MNPDFLRAVVDTLLPGEAAALTDGPCLPAASLVGVDLARHAESLTSVLAAIARAAGGQPDFLSAGEDRRAAILQSVQRDMPEAFARLLGVVLPDYYEAPAVLGALGWRSEPPQPMGHVVPVMDDATLARLERVKSGGRRWRDDA
jgi:hypothetical protein